jgi:hypothetical protein
MKSSGVPSHADQWWWGCNVYGKPSLGGDSGHGTDLDDCKKKFKIAWGPDTRRGDGRGHCEGA